MQGLCPSRSQRQDIDLSCIEEGSANPMRRWPAVLTRCAGKNCAFAKFVRRFFCMATVGYAARTAAARNKQSKAFEGTPLANGLFQKGPRIEKWSDARPSVEGADHHATRTRDFGGYSVGAVGTGSGGAFGNGRPGRRTVEAGCEPYTPSIDAAPIE